MHSRQVILQNEPCFVEKTGSETESQLNKPAKRSGKNLKCESL